MKLVAKAFWYCPLTLTEFAFFGSFINTKSLTSPYTSTSSRVISIFLSKLGIFRSYSDIKMEIFNLQNASSCQQQQHQQQQPWRTEDGQSGERMRWEKSRTPALTTTVTSATTQQHNNSNNSNSNNNSSSYSFISFHVKNDFGLLGIWIFVSILTSKQPPVNYNFFL